MKIPNRIQPDEMNLYKSLLHLLPQARSSYSFIGSATNPLRIVPFDLNDVARVFTASFASRFAHLEAHPLTDASVFDSEKRGEDG